MVKSPDYDTVIVRASMDKEAGMAICHKIRQAGFIFPGSWFPRGL